MIGKIRKGDDFHGLAAYLMRDGRGEVLDLHNLSSTDPAEAAGEMQVAALASARTKNPVMHIAVSYSTNEAPTKDQMRADAREVLQAFGLAQNQVAVIRHNDAAHQHMHLMVNRIGQNGRAVSDSHSFARAEATLRQIEARRGWKAVHGRHAPAADGKRMTGPRTSRDPNQFQPPAEVKQALLTSKSWAELRRNLAREGWRIEVVKHVGKKPGALLVGPAGERVAAGRVDRAATLARLESRLGRGPRDLTGQQVNGQHRGRDIAAPAPRIRGRRGPDLRRPGGRRKKGSASAEVKAAAERAAQAVTGLLGGAATGVGAALIRRRRPGRGPGLGL